MERPVARISFWSKNSFLETHSLADQSAAGSCLPFPWVGMVTLRQLAPSWVQLPGGHWEELAWAGRRVLR